jgi:hypothetical protein
MAAAQPEKLGTQPAAAPGAPPLAPAPFLSLYRFTTTSERALMVVGCVLGLSNGASLVRDARHAPSGRRAP